MNEKLNAMNRHLRLAYGIELRESSVEDLEFIRQNYDDRRHNILRHVTLQEANLDPEYVKAVLISEAANMLLIEIAPKRIRPRTRSKK